MAPPPRLGDDSLEGMSCCGLYDRLLVEAGLCTCHILILLTLLYNKIDCRQQRLLNTI